MPLDILCAALGAIIISWFIGHRAGGRKACLKIEALNLEIAMMELRITRQQVEIDRLERVLSLKCDQLDKATEELTEAQELIREPPYFRKGQRIGSIRILKISREEEEADMKTWRPILAVGFGALGIFCLTASLAASRNWWNDLKREHDKTVQTLERRVAGWKYKYHDEESGEDYEMPESDLKEIVRLRYIAQERANK